jgi:glycosyltransferase involved in cell wall biosynthesis
MGRIAPLKGMDDLVDVWKGVCQEIPQARLVVMGGDGAAMEGRLRNSIEQAGLEHNIDFLGFVPEGMKYSNMKASQVFLYPSYEEGWGISLAEAMACGMPAVVYDLPAYREFGGQGLIRVPIGDKVAFCRAAIHLLTQPGLRVRMGREALEAARKLSWDTVASHELEALSRVSRSL